MNLKAILASTACGLLLLSSCNRTPAAKSIEEANVSNQTDSLAYYMGLSMAGIYDQMAQVDTTLKSEEGKKKFLEGFGKVLADLNDKDDAYTAGYTAGLQLLLNNRETNKRYNISLNNQIMASAFAYALNEDSLRNNAEASQYLSNAFQAIQQKKQEADSKAAATELAKLASKGYTQIKPTLYKKVITPGNGNALTAENRLKTSISATSISGAKLNLPLPEEIIVGRTFGPNSLLTEALLSMKVGETTSFALPASEVLGGRQAEIGLKDGDAIIFTINAIEVLPSANEGVVRSDNAPTK